MGKQGDSSQSDHDGSRLVWRALPPVLIVLAGVALSFLPIATSCSETDKGVETCTTATLISDEGWRPLLILLLPPLIVSVIALVTNRRWSALASAFVVSFFMLLGVASIGIILLPAAISAGLLAWRSFQ